MTGHDDHGWAAGSPARHEHAAALACLTLIALVLTGHALIGRGALVPESILDWDPLLRTESIPPMPRFVDFSPTFFHLPKDLAFARGLHAGRIDKWDPLAGAGVPLWAEQSGPFFPLKLPFYAAPSRGSYDVFLALRLVVAALGAYCLARYRGIAPIGAIAAGASFELSGAVVAQLPFGSNPTPMCLLPWVILGGYAIAKQRTAAAAAGAGIALGIAANGGHPTMVLAVFAGFAAAIAGHVVSAWPSPRTMVSIAALGAIAALLGLALAAPSLLPLAELTSVATSYKDRPSGPRNWVKDLTLCRTVLPIGLLAPGSAGVLQKHFWTQFAYMPVIGAVVFVAAVAGVLRGRFDPALFGVGLFGIVLTTMPPGLAWVHEIPGLRLITASYAWPLVILALTQTAGGCVDASTRSQSLAAEVLGLALLLAGALTLWFLATSGVSPFDALLAEAAQSPNGLLRLGLPLILAAFAVSACFVLRRVRRVHLCAALLTALMVLEQMLTMAPLTRQRRSAVLSSPPSPAVEFLQHQLADGNGRILGVPSWIGSPLSPMLFGLSDLRARSPLPVLRHYQYMHAVSPGAGSHTLQDVPLIRSPLLDLAAVRYVVVSSRTTPADKALTLDEVAEALLHKPPKHLPAPDDPSMPLVHQDERVSIYENRRALPRVRIAHEAIRVSGQSAAAERLRAMGKQSGNADQLGMSAAVVLEPDENGREAPQLSSRASPTERVRIVDASQPDRLGLEVALESPGLVVIADTYYPGWKASVDGEPASIFPANLLFRAVYVPAGEHRVALSYEPRSFRFGVVLFALGAAVALLMLLRGRVAGLRR